ncbi:MAG: hypothetical protein EOO74_10310 [Myxococcales bacterium]|nr:MAG: hypothetical protein EOO74_10310 [Myxococcales bacterium]
MTYEEAAEWLKGRGMTASWEQGPDGRWQCEITPGDTPLFPYGASDIEAQRQAAVIAAVVDEQQRLAAAAASSV